MEIIRRHSLRTRLDIGAALMVTAGSGPTFNIAYIPVKVHTKYMRIFSAWSGTVKFRIFVYGTEPGMVMYNAHPGSFATKNNSAAAMYLGAETLSTWSGTTYVGIGARGDLHPPMEMMYQISNGVSMIDVSIPFNSQYNILPTRETDFNGSHTTTNGTLVLRYPSTARYEIFQAAGDDHRYQVFCPQAGIQMRSANITVGGTTPVGVADTEVMGNMY